MITLVPEPWVREALCDHRRSDINPDAFHASKKTPRSDVDAALALCRACPVRRECLRNALEEPDQHGIWGGLTEQQRRQLVALRQIQRQTA